MFSRLDMNHDETTHNGEEEWQDPEQEDIINEVRLVVLEQLTVDSVLNMATGQ